MQSFTLYFLRHYFTFKSHISLKEPIARLLNNSLQSIVALQWKKISEAPHMNKISKFPALRLKKSG